MNKIERGYMSHSNYNQDQLCLIDWIIVNIATLILLLVFILSLISIRTVQYIYNIISKKRSKVNLALVLDM